MGGGGNPRAGRLCLALHQQIGQFATIFPNHGLGSGAQLDSLAVFAPIVDAVITNPL